MAVLDHAVSLLASRQHGVLTTQELEAHGVSGQQVRRALERGELIRPHPNVLRVAAAPESWEQRLLVATRAGGAGCLASHRAAARLWQLDGWIAREVVEVVTPRHLRSWAPHLGRVHESTDLHLASPAERDGIPCTGIVRTLVDLGAVAPVERVHQAVDDAIRRRLCTWDDVLHGLVTHSRRGRRGVGALRAVLEESYGKQVPDSHFNRLVLRLLTGSGLPEPAWSTSCGAQTGPSWLVSTSPTRSCAARSSSTADSTT